MTRLLLLLVALFLSLSAVGCSHSEGGKSGSRGPTQGLARVRANGILRWGGDIQGGEPYVYDDPENPGHLIGFEVEIADLLAKELGVRAEFVQNDWSNLAPSLERGTFDIVMNGFEVTEPRAGSLLFTRPYYVFAERLMARKDDTAITKAELPALKGKRVGTLANSLAFEILRTTMEPVVYEGTEEPYSDLVNGRLDAVLLDDLVATRYGVPKPELRVVGDLRDGYYSIATRQEEPDLRDALDAALARIVARGDLHKILDSNHLWNDRQLKVTKWTLEDQAAMIGEPPKPPPLTKQHVWLFVKGAGVTLLVSTWAMAIAIPLGLLLAVSRLYGPKSLARIAQMYIEIYRGTPVLLQLYLLYYGLAPVFKLGALPAAIIGLGMNYAAYEAEVYRAGIQAVPKVQLEAALSLGMTKTLALNSVARDRLESERESWVLKRDLSRVGDHVFVGALIPPEEWPELLVEVEAVQYLQPIEGDRTETSLLHDREQVWIAQKFIPQKPVFSPWGPRLVTLGVYLLDGVFTGYFARLSETSHCSHDALVLPVIVSSGEDG